VASFAIRIFERISSISAELRIGGLIEAASDIWWLNTGFYY
jgi:hypothetical protein